mgnify:CR=1 FL=1
MIYGHDRTIHRTGYVDVETDEKGQVVAVWFRCATLPFKQHRVDGERARQMREGSKPPPILAIEFLDTESE